MALYSKAIQKPIPPGPTDPPIKPRAVILHIAVFIGKSLYDYFKDRSGGVESHFYIRLDGTVEQYRDTSIQADANTDANNFAISIETEGMEHGKWTDEQLASIKALILWCHKTHDIPLVRCPAWDGSGIGYHTLFPGRWDKRGASCPGPDRKLQFNQVLVPWMRAGGDEDDMSAEDVKQVNDYTKALLLDGYTIDGDKHPGLLPILVETQRRVTRSETALKALAAGLGPTVQAAVEAALEDDYEATVTLTPKTKEAP